MIVLLYETRQIKNSSLRLLNEQPYVNSIRFPLNNLQIQYAINYKRSMQ